MRRDSESAGESKAFQNLGELIWDSPAAMQRWNLRQRERGQGRHCRLLRLVQHASSTFET